MDTPNQQPQYSRNIPNKRNKTTIILCIIILLLLPIVIGDVSRKKAEKTNTTQTHANITQKEVSLSSPTNVPTPTVIACPSAPEEGEIGQPFLWKRYTCPALGVSFTYPSNILAEGGNVVRGGVGNTVDIGYHLEYIYRITKLTTNLSLTEWVSKNTFTKGVIISQITFHNYPAYLIKETQETISSVQTPENMYIVQTNPTTMYEIEYEIPRPPQDAQKTMILTDGLQKIVNSTTFFSSQ